MRGEEGASREERRGRKSEGYRRGHAKYHTGTLLYSIVGILSGFFTFGYCLFLMIKYHDTIVFVSL